VAELTHPDSNLRFDMGVTFMINYSFSRRDVPVDNETFLVTDFMNLKIKLTQSYRGTYRGTVFEGVYRGRVYAHVFIRVGTHMCMNICVCTVFLKKYT
jgi:hypothetical protein